VQVTTASGTIVMVATLPDVEKDPPPDAEHARLWKAKFAGSAPSVTLYDPAGTFAQCSVFAVPAVIGDAGSTPASSFSVKLDGVLSSEQEGVVEPVAGLGMVDV
jgi:hypothetical protein